MGWNYVVEFEQPRHYHMCNNCGLIFVVYTQYKTIQFRDVDGYSRSATCEIPDKGSECTRCQETVHVVWNDAMEIPYKNMDDFKSSVYYFPGTYIR